MKKPLSLMRVLSLSALCAGLILLWFLPAFLQKMQPERASSQAQRQLVTVWVRGDALGALPWIKTQAAAFQKQKDTVRIWVRTASDEDMGSLTEDMSAAPDLVLFAAGESISPAWLSDVQPLCMAGYALVALSEQNTTTAPASLFGITPAPQIKPAATAVPREQWPQRIAADNELGAYYLQLLQAPGGAQLLSADELPSALAQGRVQAALLSTRQIRTLKAQGVGVTLLQAVPGSDLLLFCAEITGSESAAADFMQFSQSENAQRALQEHGLFSTQGIRLYGEGTPVLQAVEQALVSGWRPEALTFPQERQALIHAAQAIYGEK